MAWRMEPRVEREFVDQFALLFENAGLPPVAGRILGRLLCCDPAHQSSQELAGWLGASAGAISTATRMLVQFGLLERVRFRGDRAVYFRIRPDAWEAIWQREIEEVGFLRRLADRGLASLDGAPEDVRRRMEDFRDLYALLEDELPRIQARWKERKP